MAKNRIELQNALTLPTRWDILAENEKAKLFTRIGRNVTGLTEIAGLPFFGMAVRLFLAANKTRQPALQQDL